MSAIILNRDSSEGITILTDGAEYAPDRGYVLSGLVNKVAMLPHLPCLIAALGNSSIVDVLVYSHGGAWSSFDQTKTVIADDLLAAHAQVARRLGSDVNARVFVGGWSDAGQRFEAFSLTMLDETEEAPALEPIAGLTIQPDLDDDALINAGLLVDGDLRLRSLDDLCAVMELQRRAKYAPRSSSPVEPFHCVGGFIQVTTLTRDGISTRILRRWPDRLGEMIDPGG